MRIGRRLPCRAQTGDHLEAGKTRQAEIDDGRVERVVGREVQRLLAVAGGVDRVVLGFQLALELLPQGGFVFDYQDAHGACYQGSAVVSWEELAHGAGGGIHIDRSAPHPRG